MYETDKKTKFRAEPHIPHLDGRPNVVCVVNRVKKAGVFLISFYQRFLSPIKRYFIYLGFFKSSGCVFYPTCSEYAKEAIVRYGALKGSWLAIGRILRCHPWQKNHMDPLR